MALVKFVTADSVSFATLSPKDADTLYFISDERRIYKGDVPMSGGIYQAVATLPATGEVNTLYVNTTDGSVSYWNGTAYQEVVKPFAATIEGTGDDSHLVTSKAVVDYMASQIRDLDVSALEGRVTTLEGQMEVVQGEGEGSINKALADAKTYTDEAIANKADKATTLEGYGITDAYTKTEADTAIATAVANADHLKREIVEVLPEAATADENTIYMVGTGAGSEDSSYEEYMLINGAFEKIGDSKVDLTGYATETQVDTAVTDAIGALDVEDAAVEGQYVSAVSEIDGKIQVTRATLPQAPEITTGTTNGTISVGGEEIAVAGLKSAAYTEASDYATAEQGAKADTALQAADITEGTANGTIAVKGTDVTVHGLGSAAFTESTAYDAAGSADQALADAKAYVEQLLTWQTL